MAHHSLWKMISRPTMLINRFYVAMAAKTKQIKPTDQKDSVTFSSNYPKEEYDLEKAIRVLKAYSLSRIDETLELSIKLNLMENKVRIETHTGFLR